MRIIVQRVTTAKVTVDQRIIGSIKAGILVLVGFELSDTDADDDFIINKLLGLRIFSDEQDKMNLSVMDVSGGILIVPNFTLYGDVRKGFRPSFSASCPVEIAKTYYERFAEKIQHAYSQVEFGVFQGDMAVELVNDGPVTILLDSKKLF
jgi:D-aminoacyl-tRNA deacylase